jgi:aryl-alcohol dehydrogenase
MRGATAAVVEAAGALFVLQEVELDDPRPGEVLVRMTAVGLCATDLSVRAGGSPFPLAGVLGHEGAGVIEAVGGPESDLRPGQKVLLSFTSCGHCLGCRNGHPAFCDTWLARNMVDGRREDGSATIHRNGEPLGGHFFGQSSFATYAIADERNVVSVADDSPLEILAPTDTVNSGTEDIGEAVREITEGRGLDYAVDTTGNPRVLRSAIDALAIRGTCAVVGIPPAGTEVSLDVQGQLLGKRFVGATMGDVEPRTFLPRLIELHRRGRLPIERLISHYPLSQLETAATDMREGRVVKPVICF